MHVQIVLDSSWTTYTNLDFIRGRVILRLPSPTPITSIVVKLEGESRTRLMHPGNKEGGERPRPIEECHKVLYKLATVLPNERDTTDFATYQRHYILNAGHYEYPFEFKLPFNNACQSAPPAKDLTIAGFRLEVSKGSNQHIKGTLPPTITAYPGVAEIRYYVKVTVSRKEFYKENPRVFQPFVFVPIEPPRPPPSNAENYARRQHTFALDPAASGSKMKNFFSGKKSPDPPVGSTGSDEPPRIGIDARLPNPAILTCGQDIPLRIMLKKLNESRSLLYLQSIQIELLSATKIRVHDLHRTEDNSWIIVSMSNMNFPLEQPSESTKSDEIVIDPGIWKGKVLPNNVAPTFEACNMSRKYGLQIRVGISHGPNRPGNVVVLPLQMAVLVYSGITPPAALLAAMSGRSDEKQAANPKATVTKKPLSAQAAHNVAQASRPAAPGAPGPTAYQTADEEEPPPSYEDAIAQNVGPIDGPRNYQPPPVPQGGGFPMDEKGH